MVNMKTTRKGFFLSRLFCTSEAYINYALERHFDQITRGTRVEITNLMTTSVADPRFDLIEGGGEKMEEI